MKTTMSGTVLTLALLAGCSPAGGLRDARHATGTNTMVASSDYASAYVVNTDAGTLARVSSDGQVLGNELAVGQEPTRIARAGDRVFVTLRAERAVVVLKETPAGLVEDGRIDVGAEPYGIVANEDGTRVYVANSMSDSVEELDARSYESLRRWTVPNEPRYLALHPSEKTLFVGSGRGQAVITKIDLTAEVEAGSEQPTEPIAVPDVVRLGSELDSTGMNVKFELTPRITGDMAISPDGAELVVPVLYVDNVTPVADPILSDDGDPQGPVDDGYGGVSEGISRFNPGLAVVPVGVDGDADVAASEAVFVSGFRDSNQQFDLIRVRSYPSSVTIAPDGLSYVVTMQGSDAIAVVGALPFERDEFRDFEGDVAFSEPMPDGEFRDQVFTSLSQAGFQERPKAFIWGNGTAGPDGVLFLDDKSAFVHGGFDRTLANIDFDNVFDGVIESGREGFDMSLQHRVLSVSAPVTDHRLPDVVESGRRLFFSATSPGMVASGAGVSCASCHFEGRNDGLTWTFESGMRQTPSLAGQVSATAPVTWTDNVESVSHEARITTEARMGGTGLSDSQLSAIAAFVDYTRIPDSALRGARDESIARGQAIFERADVGCSSCHNGQAFTDNGNHDMFGLTQVNTPTLLGIASSGPYLHDGRAQTLRDVLEWSRSGEMGDTSMLSGAEMDDLEAYLRSL